MNQKIPYNSKSSINELAKKLAKGDPDAIAKIYESSYQSLFYFGLQVAGNHQVNLVEDTIQDLFIWLAKNYQKVADIQNLEGYLYQSIRQNLNQKLQANQEKKEVKQRYLTRTAPNNAKNTPSPEVDFLEEEQKELDKSLLDLEIQALPTYQKEVLYLRFYENKNYKEIAEILSLNAQVARNYVFKALTVLRKNMKKLP